MCGGPRQSARSPRARDSVRVDEFWSNRGRLSRGVSGWAGGCVELPTGAIVTGTGDGSLKMRAGRAGFSACQLIPMPRLMPKSPSDAAPCSSLDSRSERACALLIEALAPGHPAFRCD